MPLVISDDDAVVVNDVTLQGSPAVRITGADVHFTNSESGRLISQSAGVAALVLDGIGATVVNELGGIITGFTSGGSPFPSGPAIQGSAGADTIANYGLVAGHVYLGEGNDSFEQGGSFYGSYAMDLGGGDDVFIYHGQYDSIQEVQGGAGTDTLRLTGNRTYYATTITGMEVLDIGRDVTNLVNFSGFGTVTLAVGGRNNLVGCYNPDADLIVRGGLNSFGGDVAYVAMNLGSAVRSITGTDGRESVETSSGIVVEGVDLGGGDDAFAYQPAGSGGLPVGDLVDGGTGTDLFSIYNFGVDADFAVDMASVVNFETLRVANFNGDPMRIDIINASGFDHILLESRATLGLVGFDGDGTTMQFLGLSTIELDGGSSLGSLDMSYPGMPADNIVQGDLSFSATVVNAGAILGDLRFHIGDDLYDGRSGTIGGTLYGYAGNDIFLGGAGSERIEGGYGADTLDGGGGVDLMYGFEGNDLFTVRNASDRAVEAAGDGFDRVNSSASFALEAGSEVEMLTTTDNLATVAINLTGNSVAQYLYGNAGANALDGGGGGDVMYGFEGNDLFTVRNASDRAVEAAGGGFDRVYAAVSFALGAGSEVEMLTTIDNLSTSAISLTGNELAQYLYGNAGSNQLDGGGGGDVMYGFGGNDFFVVRNASDRVVESAGGGTDRVFAGASFTLEAGSEVEMLTTVDNLATNAINLTGNALAQYIYGNAGANTLDGGGGGDVMYGFEGDDFFVIRNASDRAVEAAGGGSDRVFAAASFTLEAGSEIELLTTADNLGTSAIDLSGNALAQYLYGNSGANTLDGKAGADVMTGLAGADNFAFTSALGGGNVDRIADFVAADDTIRLDDAVFTGLALGALNANAFVIGTQAGDADDRIIYNQATGALLFDADGSGGASAAVHFATLDGAPIIAASDFIVV